MATTKLRAWSSAALIALALPAQDPIWRIPPQGAVEFRREWRATASAAVASAQVARSAAPVGAPPGRYLSRLVPAPWLCHGELADDGRSIGGQVADLRDALRRIACDVGARGAVRVSLPRLLPFGDVTITGSWSSPDAAGVQRLRGRLAARRPAPQGREPRDVAERLQALCVADADGSVALTRRWDGEAGVVAEFDGAFDLVVVEGPKAHRRLCIEDRWQLVAVHTNQDFDFRKRVAAAIRSGTDWVRAAIDTGESFLVDRGGDDRNYGSGRLALGLLTLLHGHVPVDDPVVQRGFAELFRRRIDDGYSLAAALMAMAALHAPPGEAVRLRGGELAEAPILVLPERDAKVAGRWLERLLHCSDPRTDPGDRLRFNYTRGPRYDTSLQQYGLLGLWSAHRCGIAVPKAAFAAAARHLLDVQGAAAGTLTLSRSSHAQVQAALGTGGAPAADRQRARLRGFAYQEAVDPPFGSMTSAGISGLLLARAGMAAQGERDRALEDRIDEAIRDGFAWLADAFSVRLNPGFAERADNHVYYWLYGLERCCELAGVARLQGRDWYYEGALQLLSHQLPDGSFRAAQTSTLLLDSTCFAVLFLAKATAPVPITGR